MAIPHRTDRLLETKLNKKNPQRVAEGLVRVHLLFLIPSWFYLDPEQYGKTALFYEPWGKRRIDVIYKSPQVSSRNCIIRWSIDIFEPSPERLVAPEV